MADQACSFGAAAAAYAEHRPDYAEAAVRWALEPAAGMRVLDLGAGTGKLTATLVAAGADVTAVEPDPAMLAELRRGLPDVRALPGRVEAIPLPDASVDAVLAGNALHWFDMAAAGPEIARVRRPRGVLAGLWNVVDDWVGWVAGQAERHLRLQPGSDQPGQVHRLGERVDLADGRRRERRRAGRSGGKFVGRRGRRDTACRPELVFEGSDPGRSPSAGTPPATAPHPSAILPGGRPGTSSAGRGPAQSSTSSIESTTFG